MFSALISLPVIIPSDSASQVKDYFLVLVIMFAI
nr:MAG TPA: hypothetical protein [Caudoviricetes sp.]